MSWQNDFDPRLTYTMKRAQIGAWIDHFGEAMWFQGDRWFIKTKHIAAGRYKVWFEREA